MFRRILFSLAVLVGSMPLWCQVEPSATGGSGATDDDSLMTLPPAISGSFYPSEVGSQERENLLSGGVLFTAAYDDNVLAGEGTGTIGAESYSILPNIEISTSTSRLRGSLNYSPGFMFFHPTTYLNQVTQNADADFQFRWTPHTTVAVQEVFRQNSTVFSEPYTLSGATISGSGGSGYPIVIAPYAGQISDSTSAHVGYQFSRSSMISASGNYSSFNFSNSTASQGLYNSHGGGGSGSYSRRFGRMQYLGLSYRYAISETTPYPSTTESQFATVFYSVRLSNSFSLSASGGPEYTTTSVARNSDDWDVGSEWKWKHWVAKTSRGCCVGLFSRGHDGLGSVWFLYSRQCNGIGEVAVHPTTYRGFVRQLFEHEERNPVDYDNFLSRPHRVRKSFTRVHDRTASELGWRIQSSPQYILRNCGDLG